MAPKLPIQALRSFRPISSLSNMSRISPSVPSRITPNTTLAGFHTSASQSLKEDGNRSPHELEAKKKEHLKKQERGDGKWDEELASKGEENVKADREDVQDHGEHMEDLQKRTEEKSEKGAV